MSPNLPQKQSPSKTESQPRREFLRETLAAATCARWTSAGLGVTLGVHTTSNVSSASNGQTINVGLVGCGARGVGVINNILDRNPDARVVALADIFQPRIDNAVRTISRKHQGKFSVPKARQFIGLTAYEELMNEDIDVVVLATPPGFRPQHFELAIQTGRHVFMENPLAVDATGIRRVVAANRLALRKKLAVGCGFQYRHSKNTQDMCARLQGGAIGKIRSIRAERRHGGVWVRPRQPNQSELEYQLTNWYYFVWLSGDYLVEQVCQNLDLCNWVIGDSPIQVTGSGGRKERKGSDHGEIYDHFNLEYRYRDGTILKVESSHWPSNKDKSRNEITVMGARGSAEVISGNIIDSKGNSIWRSPRPIMGNAYQEEQVALFQAIRRGQRYNEVGQAVAATMTGIMGRTAAYEGREIKWDDAFASTETYQPQEIKSFADTPPSLPDKFGDYQVPARGKLS